MKAIIICEEKAIKKWDYIRLIKSFLEAHGFSLVNVDYSCGKDIVNFDGIDLVIVHGLDAFDHPALSIMTRALPVILYFNSKHPKAINNQYLDEQKHMSCDEFIESNILDGDVVWAYAKNQQDQIMQTIRIIKMIKLFDGSLIWVSAGGLALLFIIAFAFILNKTW